MTRVLTAGRKEPQSGDARSAVVFLHGYGANGADLLGLADPLADRLSHRRFMKIHNDEEDSRTERAKA